MKRLLALVLAVMLAMGLVTFASAEDEGKTLVVIPSTKSQNLDPYADTIDMDSIVMTNVFDNLWQRDENCDYHGMLAKEWSLSEDGTYYTVTLRDDVTFSDGTPVNTDAVIYSYQSALKMSSWGYTYSTVIKDIEKVDDYTFKIYKYASYSSIIPFCTDYLPIVSPTARDGHEDEFAKNPVGSGAYTVESFDTVTNYVVLKAREDYFQGAPAIKTVEVRVPLDSAVALVALENDEAQLIEMTMNESDVQIAASENFTVYTCAGWACKTLLLWGEPFNSDNELALAVNQAVNRENVAAYMGHDATPATNYYSEKLMGRYANKVPVYQYDMEAAKEHLAASNYDGSTLAITVTPDQEMAGLSVQADLTAIGINSELNIVETSTYYDMWYDATVGITIADFGVAYSSPEEMLSYFATDGFYNMYGLSVSNEAYDTNLKKAAETWDDDEREPYTLAAIEAARDLSQYVPLYDIQMKVVGSAKLQGIDACVPATYRIYLWKAYFQD